MKVLHFILGKANKDRANGVNQVIAGLCKYSSRLGAEVLVIGKAETVAHEGERIQRDGFEVEAYSHWGKPLRMALIKAIEWADVVHLHGTYSPWNFLVGRMCNTLCRPYIVTLHDGLAPERLKARGGIRKRFYHALLQRRHLESAAGIHVLTEEEATELYSLVRPKRVFCIPNGVDLDDFPSAGESRQINSVGFNIGYLGRISAEKNLEALCEAFVIANFRGDLRLRLAGPQTTFGNKLLNRFSKQGVEWVGPKFGQEKIDFIRSLDLFVHPSLCDVFSISGMEVLAMGTPLLITRTSKVCYFYNSGAFFMCEPTVFGIEQGLHRVFQRRSAWLNMAKKGRSLVETRLNWQAAARDLLCAYEIITGAHQ